MKRKIITAISTLILFAAISGTILLTNTSSAFAQENEEQQAPPNYRQNQDNQYNPYNCPYYQDEDGDGYNDNPQRRGRGRGQGRGYNRGNCPRYNDQNRNQGQNNQDTSFRPGNEYRPMRGYGPMGGQGYGPGNPDGQNISGRYFIDENNDGICDFLQQPPPASRQ